MLLAHKAASEETTQVEILHQAARVREIERHTQAHLEQFQKDQVMLKQIEADEQKVHAQKLQVEAGKREAVEWDAALKQIQEQRATLLELMKKRKAKADAEFDQRVQDGEEEYVVEISMDTGEMDYTIVEEQGQLLKALSEGEEQAYSRLVMVEMNQIQWKYEALSYLNSLIKGNKEAQQEGNEMRGPGEVYPRLWKYLGFRNLLMPLKEKMLNEDPYTSAVSRLKAAKKMHDNWKMQQRRAMKPSQLLAQSRSHVDQSRPPLASIRCECPFAEILFTYDYDKADLLTEGIHLFSPNDSDNDVIQKLQQMQELCGECGVTPANELNLQTLVLLRTFGFGDDQPKKKLMVYLGMQKKKNAFALLMMSEEVIGTVGLGELAREGIYEIDVSREIPSAILELNGVLDSHQPRLSADQQSWQEQIGVKIAQECDNAKLDFQMDERVDKKT